MYNLHNYKEPYVQPYFHRKPRDHHAQGRMIATEKKISIQKQFLQRAARLFGCSSCRERDSSCLSFYAVRGYMLKAIRIRHCKSVDEVKRELSQGIVLCLNCHKIETAPIHRSLSKLRTYKLNQGCQDCRVNDPDVLELHHRVQKQKRFDISRKQCSVAPRIFEKELDKIDVLCANCHAKRHCSS